MAKYKRPESADSVKVADPTKLFPYSAKKIPNSDPYADHHQNTILCC